MKRPLQIAPVKHYRVEGTGAKGLGPGYVISQEKLNPGQVIDRVSTHGTTWVMEVQGQSKPVKKPVPDWVFGQYKRNGKVSLFGREVDDISYLID